LLEPASDDKAARARFISNLQFGAWVSFADASQRALHSLNGIEDGAEEADLAFGPGFGNGDGDRVFMDIETKVECNVVHGVVVSLYSFDESERIPRHKRGRSCGSAHPGNPR
jgi:hypothetical protein